MSHYMCNRTINIQPPLLSKASTIYFWSSLKQMIIPKYMYTYAYFQCLLVVYVLYTCTCKELFCCWIKSFKVCALNYLCRGAANEWYEALNCHLRSSKKVRIWFAHNVLFSNTNRFSEYLLECPSSEVS